MGRLWDGILMETLANTRRVAIFHMAVLVYSAIVIAVALDFDQLQTLAHGAYLARLGPVYLFILPGISLICLISFVMHKTNDWRERRRMVGDSLSPRAIGRVLSGMLCLFSFVLFMGSFTTFKNLMPVIRGGFPDDILLAEIDRVLSFGQDPGAVLVEFAGSPVLRQVIEWNYGILWGLFGFIPVFFICTMKAADGLRLRYLLTVVSAWAIVGSLLALIFLSAGPAFYGKVTGDVQRFAVVLDFLSAGTPGTAAMFQDYLWSSYISGDAALGTGISAFPSVHVAMAMTNALFLREINRTAGWFGFAYVGLVLFSSVYLGWHYAIDGYVSIIIVLGLYAVIRRLCANDRDMAYSAGPEPMPLPPPTV